MEKPCSVFVLLGILHCCVSVFAIDCSNKHSIQREQVKCFSRLGLTLNVPPDQIQQVIQNDPEAACRNPAQYKSALQCVMHIGTRCLERIGQSSNILPDVDKMMDGITYMCDNIHQVDSDCARNKQAALQQCAMSKALAAFSGNTNMDVTFITCKSFELTNECMLETLDTCAKKTAEVYSNLVVQYLTPPACGTHKPDPGYKFPTTMAPLHTPGMVTVMPVLPQVSCYSASSMHEGQTKCFEREGIKIQLPEVNLRSSMQAKQSLLDSILANNHDIRTVCRNLPKYQRAMGCAMDVARQCIPSEYRDYVPDARSMQMMLSELCENADDIDEECVAGKTSELFDCGFEKGRNSRMTDLKALLCKSYEWNVVCQRSVLPSCGCKTTALYIRMSKSYLNPPACRAITEPTPQCIGNSERFASGGGMCLGASVFILVALAFLSCFTSF